jgi:hypothetical protein
MEERKKMFFINKILIENHKNVPVLLAAPIPAVVGLYSYSSNNCLNSISSSTIYTCTCK